MLLIWLPDPFQIPWHSVDVALCTTVDCTSVDVPAHTLLSSLPCTNPQQSFLALAPAVSLICLLSLPYRLKKRKELLFFGNQSELKLV